MTNKFILNGNAMTHIKEKTQTNHKAQQFTTDPHECDIALHERDFEINKPFSEIINIQLHRRQMMKWISYSALALVIHPTFIHQLKAQTALSSTLGFTEVPHNITDNIEIPKGYTSQTLLSWGDSLIDDTPINFGALTGVEQEKRFGFNTDFIGYLPLPLGSKSSTHGLLGINNEYSLIHLMQPGLKMFDRSQITPNHIDIEKASVGFNVVEVELKDNQWAINKQSVYNRRITAQNTVFTISGPAAHHNRLKTSKHPLGNEATGTLANCSGGTTPWGTFLSGEENWHGYFINTYPEDSPEAKNGSRYGINGRPYVNWGDFDRHYDVLKEPNAPHHYGWVIEVDPYSPSSPPVKRTALGRFKHEGCGLIKNHDDRIVIFMGDDERFEYIYRFVSQHKLTPSSPEKNKHLLDEGTLSVAQFFSDGTLQWHPLTYGHGPLTQDNNFFSQADVLIETRRAADLLKATPMDRPESVTPHPFNGRIYAMLTGNKKRTQQNVDFINKRAKNIFGQIIEFMPKNSHSSNQTNYDEDIYVWNLLMECGDPNNPEHNTQYPSAVTQEGWFARPDNCQFDNQGRMWIGTDSGFDWKKFGFCDGLYACDVEGDGRARTKQFLRAPIGAEITGPCFTPDHKTLFVSIQHPGDTPEATFDKPTTRWPTFEPETPPLPSVIAIRKDDGGIIGS